MVIAYVISRYSGAKNNGISTWCSEILCGVPTWSVTAWA